MEVVLTLHDFCWRVYFGPTAPHNGKWPVRTRPSPLTMNSIAGKLLAWCLLSMQSTLICNMAGLESPVLICA